MSKLAVGPAWASPFVWTKFTESALNLEHPEGWDVKWFFGKGWCPARRHIDLCEQALGWGADLICFAGADQVYPTDTLVRLVNRITQGYDVVGAMVPARGYIEWMDMKPFQPMAWRFKRGLPPRIFRGYSKDKDMVEIITPADGEMQQVQFMGSGVLMFPSILLAYLKRPWFFETVQRETYTRFANQDVNFVWRLQEEALAKVWVDTTIKVGHIHSFVIDETFQDRFPDWTTGHGDPEIAKYISLK